MVKDFLNRHNISFEDIDVSKDHEAAQEMIEKSGQMGVPVIIIEDKEKEAVIIGFDKGKLKAVLKIED